jgi:hypothetical protein
MNRFRPLVLSTVRTMSIYYALLATASLLAFVAELDTSDKVVIWLLAAGAAGVMLAVTETVRYLYKRFARTGWSVTTAYTLIQVGAFTYVLITSALPTIQPTLVDWAIVLLVIPICILLTTIVALLHPATIIGVFSRRDVAA